MADFFELCEGTAAGEGSRLEEARISDEPLTCLVFTKDAERAFMHYEKDPAVSAYVICPGDGCPLCRLGSRPKEFILLPILDLASSSVGVLRISTRIGPTTLLDQLKPHMRAEQSADQLLLIERVVNVYTVKSSTLAKSADRGTGAITDFLAARQKGLRLTSAFTSMTAEELSNVSRVRRLLDARGLDSAPGEPE